MKNSITKLTYGLMSLAFLSANFGHIETALGQEVIGMPGPNTCVFSIDSINGDVSRGFISDNKLKCSFNIRLMDAEGNLKSATAVASHPSGTGILEDARDVALGAVSGFVTIGIYAAVIATENHEKNAKMQNVASQYCFELKNNLERSRCSEGKVARQVNSSTQRVRYSSGATIPLSEAAAAASRISPSVSAAR